MSLKLRSVVSKERTTVPAGVHIGRVDQVVDLGTQTTTFKGESKTSSQLYVRFELPEELLDDGRPSVIGKIYTASFGKKSNLRKDVEQMLGKTFDDNAEFDAFSLLGKTASVTVVHKTTKDGKTFANIGGLSPLHKSLRAPEAINEPVAFDLDNYSEDTFNKLPEWLKTKINRVGVVAQANGADVEGDDGLDDL